MNQELKQNLLSQRQWVRLLFMVLFIMCLYAAVFIAAIIIPAQFIFSLITGENNPKLRRFSANLSYYIYQVFLFLTYNTEKKPFPFDDFHDVSSSSTLHEHAEESDTEVETSDVVETDAEKAKGNPQDEFGEEITSSAEKDAVEPTVGDVENLGDDDNAYFEADVDDNFDNENNATEKDSAPEDLENSSDSKNEMDEDSKKKSQTETAES